MLKQCCAELTWSAKAAGEDISLRPMDGDVVGRLACFQEALMASLHVARAQEQLSAEERPGQGLLGKINVFFYLISPLPIAMHDFCQLFLVPEPDPSKQLSVLCCPKCAFVGDTERRWETSEGVCLRRCLLSPAGLEGNTQAGE